MGTNEDMKQSAAEWKPMIEHVLHSKVDEFLLMGYSRTTKEDIWTCLEKKVWKGNPVKRIHEVVQDVLHLNASVYMSYLTVDAYQDDDLMASIAALTNEDAAEK